MKRAILTLLVVSLILVFVVLTTAGKALAQPPAPTPWGDVVIYGSNSYGGQEVVEINLTQGSDQNVGTTFPNQALAQDPVTGYVYFFEWQMTGDDFGYWNPATGNNVIVRHYVPAPGFYAKRMAFAPDGTLYMMDSGEELYTIDKLTGAYTSLGVVSGLTTGVVGGTGDMAFAPDGTLYIATYEDLFTVDMDTLTADPLYQDMIDITDKGLTVWTGLAFCGDQLYASHAEEFTGSSAIFHIDPATGSTTELFYTDTILNDLTSCQPRVEVCDVATDGLYNFYIDPLNVQVRVNQVGTLDCVHMRRFNASHPQATLPLQTGYYWDIVGLDSTGNPATGFNVDLTLPTTFTPDELDKVCRRDESVGSWACSASYFGATSITTTGVQAFSAWTVGNNAGPTAVRLDSVTALPFSAFPVKTTFLVLLIAGLVTGIFWFWARKTASAKAYAD